MQTLKHKANAANDITPSFERPDVAQASAKGNFANLKMVLTLISLAALLVGYSYYRYSSNRKQEAKPSKSLEAQEIVGKDWVLGKVGGALEEERQERKEPRAERPFPASKLNHYRLRAGRLMIGTRSAVEFKLKLIPI